MELLRCAECMLLATCLFAVTVYPTSADRQNLDRLNEISWSLRQLTNHSTSGNAGTVKEVAVVILPCKELVQGSYLRRFLNKLLMYSSVDYRVTRVSLWWEKIIWSCFFFIILCLAIGIILGEMRNKESVFVKEDTWIIIVQNWRAWPLSKK